MGRWATESGQVNVVMRRDPGEIRYFCTNTKNINSQKDLYSFIDFSGALNRSLETDFYAKLDGSIASFTEEIISTISAGEVPAFDKKARRFFWQALYYNAHKRHPRPYIEDLSEAQIAEIVRDVKGEMPERSEHQIRADLLVRFQDEEYMRNVVQLSRATQTKEVVDALSEIPVLFYIPEDGREFILSDTVISESGQPACAISLGPSVCATTNYRASHEELRLLSRVEVRSLNEQLYRRSHLVVGRSRRLLKSLVKRIDGVRLQTE
ncbi:MAG: hypothetical protein CMK04_17740 [Ponticaulis sp.]|nr:hypothetical protein [Ponticaulis sp.]HBH88696.1 hypothetical protein [Hyphomonadaceae bacterium]|tara:strand:- start:43896 stop:44693 length:798 start_codon:yes stop_codon:yes gene_type:complete